MIANGTSGHGNQSVGLPACLLCGQSLRREATLFLGPLVACNRFGVPGTSAFETHELSMAQCDDCGLIQLASIPPVTFVRPRNPWVRYNEPEAHLDSLAESLRGVFPIAEATAIGVGPFDRPLLDRLGGSGVIWQDLDLAVAARAEAGTFPYLETVQASLCPGTLAEHAARHGTADLVSCRYLLEHAHHPIAALQGLGALAKPGGVVLVEVPDSTKFLANRDYSFIWEEHVCYFTEDTFRVLVSQAGFEVGAFFRYPGLLEDALVFALRAAGPQPGRSAPQGVAAAREAFQGFLAGFGGTREQYARALEGICSRGQKVVIFGAGHQSIMFINALGLQRYISYVIDDSRDKAGLLVPGTGIEIVSSEKLMSDPSIAVCLLGVSPAAEPKIRAKCADYLVRGGRMVSIFPGSGSATLIDH